MEIHTEEVHAEEVMATGLSIKIVVALDITNRTYSVYYKAYDKDRIKIWETELRGVDNKPLEFKTLPEAIESARIIFRKEKVKGHNK